MKLQKAVENQAQIVLSAISYAELRYGAIGKKASPKHGVLVDEFVKRVDSIEPWDQAAVDAAVEIKQHLSALETIIGNNDIAIAGHAVALEATLVTNNISEFNRVSGLRLEGWATT